MIELKAFTFGLGQYTEDGSPCVVAFDGEKNPRLASDEKFYLKSESDKVIAEYQEKILVLEKSYKKLVKKLVHESSVAESYRSLIYKDDALKYKEEGNLEMYDELSKKSDKAYRHANRWRRIFRKLSQEEK